ncbi:PDR/VanB family oxidoreductase [Neptuniibacter halophilus]|uniref:PDR/VanB family oxidoreductase n=1 Tax=Neptuniibacter halophilus TaxID=651666 RepID=UPI0025738A77|nr:PDR/VanB family oxidoreductase [Neptuniibacter halophilus]
MNIEQISVRVSAVEQVAPTIREFTLRPLSGELPPFSSGSHVVVEMPGAQKIHRNAYSLMSDPWDTSEYRIAVRLQEDSRGGSRFMHQSVAVGDRLNITPPANMFAPQWEAKKHILIAGGVGITPFLSYLPELMRRDADFELHYLYRGSQTGAYRKELAAELGARYFAYDSDAAERCELTELFQQRPLGTHFYICGPLSLIEGMTGLAAEFGIPASAIHYEEFAAPQPGKPFEIEIRHSGQVIRVGEEESMLEALEAAQINVPNLCRGGVCGQCVCSVESGEVDHRDNFLSAEEKASGRVVMPCVSRAKSERLIVDIQE